MARISELSDNFLESIVMPMKRAITQPLPLVLLGAGLGLSLVMAVVPQLDRWSGRAPLVFGLGLLAYAAAVVVLARTAENVDSPELRQVRRVRNSIAGPLDQVQRERPALASFVSDAVEHLDEQIIPALRQLVLRQRGPEEYLARHDPAAIRLTGSGGRVAGPAPDSVFLDRVRAIYKRQREAIDVCMQQAVNAEATLVAIVAAGDDGDIATRARSWADDLLSLQDFLDDALRGGPSTPAPLPQPNEEEPSAGRDFPASALDLPGHVEMERLTEEALKVMNNHFALAKCALMERVPCTLGAIRRSWGPTRLPGATPFEQAQALNEVLVQAIERLKPADESRPGDQALLYHVVRDRYLEGKTIAQIAARRSIGDRTVHRYTAQGRAAIARELREQEALHAQARPDLTTTG